MDLRIVQGDYCDCFFNKTEVKQNGGWEKDEDSNMAAHQRDAPACVQNCRDQFLEKVSPDYLPDDSETLESVCSKLTTKGPNQDLWPLYWCDLTFCGVANYQSVKGGDDPNVNLIINECNGIGYHSVFDPGPPPQDYTCITDATKTDGSLGLCSNIHLPEQTSSAEPQPAGAHTSTRQSTILATQNGGAPTTTTSSSNGVPVAVQTGADSSSPSTAAATPSDNQLATGAKVAIALSSALGLLLIAWLALFLLRRQRRQQHRDSTLPSNPKFRIRYAFPPPGSPTTPLIPSPTTTRPPLTPPLRLRDRRFLPSIILRQSRSPSPPLTPLNPVHFPGSAVFPSSPICSPTTNRLVPRHERTPKIYQPPSTPPPSSSPPPLPPLPPPPAYFHDRDSASSTFAPSTKSSSISTGTGGISLSSLRNETVSLLSLPPPPPPPPQSPARPPRPHEAPLVIPDLVSPAASPAASSPVTVVSSTPTSPAGPPPNRALPARPGQAQVQTPVIVVDGASRGSSPELGQGQGSGRGMGETGGGWVGQKIRGRG